jgi:riboflavin transporter FmnP
MTWLNVLLPGSLLFAKFMMKLCVDRSPSLPDVVIGFIALPVDIAFLAASLLTGYVISSAPNQVGIGLLFSFMALAILIVVLWRRSDSLFTKDRYVVTMLLAALNYLFSLSILLYAVNLLSQAAVRS